MGDDAGVSKGWILGALAFGVGACTLAFMVGQGQQSGVADLLREQNVALEGETRRLREEVAGLRDELSRSLDQQDDSLNVSGADADESAAASVPRQGDASTVSRSVSLREGTTEVLFDGALLVSLVAMDFTGSPLRHQAEATFLVEGEEPTEVRGMEVGDRVDVGQYEIVLASAGTFSSSFLIRTTQPDGPEQNAAPSTDGG